jgi:DNA polymerase III subunit epsilon
MILSCSAGAARADASTSDTTEIERLDPEALERMAARLEASGDYRILRRLEPRQQYHAPDGTQTRRGIFLDVETTGLDPATDEIVELAMVPFDFASDGRIFAVHEPFSRFRDPGRPIPAAVTALTGITDAMVVGESIDAAEIEAFLGPAALVIAHNAGFDRRFVEKLCGAFVTLPWACSWAEVPWTDEGFDGAELGHLATAQGFFHDGHRAVHDCHAGIEILARTLPRSGRIAMGVLLESARQPRWRIWAVRAPFERKDSLKRRGDRWCDGADGRARAWNVDVADHALESELAFLRREIYRRDDVDIDAQRISAFERYSGRA